MSQSEAFKKAAEDSKKLTAKPENEELLSLYGTQPTAVLTGEERIRLTNT